MRLEDFDDEEEFLVAGGDVEEAKTRKEWGLALHAEIGGEEEDEMADSKEDMSKKAQAEKIKMYRESERLRREKKMMIKPAKVEKLSLEHFTAKVEGRFAKVNGQTMGAHQAAEQGEQATQQPKAPDPFEAAAVPGKMVVMDEEDDDEDEIVIRGNTVPSTPAQLPRAGVSSSVKGNVPAVSAARGGESAMAAAKGAMHKRAEVQNGKSPKKSALVSKPTVHITSPPAANKKRAQMRNELLRTAQSRSEHLISAERSGIKIKREAPPNFSREMDLAAQPDPFPNLTLAFISSAKYVGSKKGYIFHLGDRGLGYYKDRQQLGVDGDAEDDDIFDSVSKASKVKLAGNDSGMDSLLVTATCSSPARALLWISSTCAIVHVEPLKRFDRCNCLSRARRFR